MLQPRAFSVRRKMSDEQPSTSSRVSPSRSRSRTGPHRGKKQGINLFRLALKLANEDSTVEYCQQLGLIGREASCPSCKAKLNKIYVVKRAGRSHSERRFQCNKKTCKAKHKNQIPIRKGTWFGKSHLSLRKSLLLVYCFIEKLPYKHTIRETSISSADSDSDNANILTTSTETIADYFSYCREVCQWSVETKLHCGRPIGGPGLTVEIDESKFGKTKYHRGRFVEGQWVFGGICRETREVFLVALPDNKRDRDTLEPIILQYIKAGSTIISDCWKVYHHLGAAGFNHLSVNHSYHFVDPETGAHTNNVENLWWQIKRQLSETYTRHANLSMHLCEYMWRLAHNNVDQFEAFMEDAAELYKPK